MSGEPFPENGVVLLKTHVALVKGVEKVFGRPLRPTDPHASVGCYADVWQPGEMAIGQYDPAVSMYLYGVQTFVKHTNEEEARTLHNLLAYRIRAMLYRDNTLRLAFASLTYVDGSVTERIQKWGVRQQRFAANEIDGDFMFVSTSEFYIESETV